MLLFVHTKWERGLRKIIAKPGGCHCIQNAVFWGVAPCRCSGLNRRFGGSYRLLTLVFRSRIFLPWRWRQYDRPKRRFNPLHLHGATHQKTAFFIVTAVKTSNLSLYKVLEITAIINSEVNSWFPRSLVWKPRLQRQSPSKSFEIHTNVSTALQLRMFHTLRMTAQL
jgi:hypothetical protein